jgi:transcriptional regulator with XRE-family HTH domain
MNPLISVVFKYHGEVIIMSEREEYRLLRLKKKIKLKELAIVLNCHKSHISNFENSRNGMSLDKVIEYKKYIDGKGAEQDELMHSNK